MAGDPSGGLKGKPAATTEKGQTCGITPLRNPGFREIPPESFRLREGVFSGRPAYTTRLPLALATSRQGKGCDGAGRVSLHETIGCGERCRLLYYVLRPLPAFDALPA